MVVGFYVHTDMNFVATERREKAGLEREGMYKGEAIALPGAYDQ